MAKTTPGEQWSFERGYKLPKELLEKFHKEVDKLRLKMFGKDCDGHCPVNVHIVDRTRSEPNHYFDIPYRHKIEDDKELTDEQKAVKLEERLDLLLTNVSMAAKKVECELEIRRHERHEQDSSSE